MSIDKRFLCSIYRSAPTPFGAFDINNKELIYSSGLAEKILGYSKEEISRFAENDFNELVHPEDRAKNEEILRMLNESKDGEVVRTILRVRASNGDYRHFQINDMVYERDENDKPTKFSTVIQDVTREADLKEKFEAASKTIESIRFKNSHELRAPVATIMSIVDLIGSEDFHNEYQRELFQYLGKTIQKLDEIIHEINEESSR